MRCAISQTANATGTGCRLAADGLDGVPAAAGFPGTPVPAARWRPGGARGGAEPRRRAASEPRLPCSGGRQRVRVRGRARGRAL